MSVASVDLRYVRLTGCSNLKSLPPSLGLLSGLHQLHLRRCHQLKIKLERLPFRRRKMKFGFCRLTRLRQFCHQGVLKAFGQIVPKALQKLPGCPSCSRCVDNDDDEWNH